MDDLSKNPVFLEIVELVRKEAARQVDQRPSRTAALEEEKRQLSRQIAGWEQSLGRPDLDQAVRRSLEGTWAEANRRLGELDQELAAELVMEQRRQVDIDPDDVARRLQELHQALAGDNATAINFELALHVDEVRCSRDGNIEMRTCKLGIVPDSIELVRNGNGGPAAELNGNHAGHRQGSRARRRTRLALQGEDRQAKAELMEFALDPQRFAGLPAQFFWTDSFQVPRRVTWPEAHAEEVYRRWKEGTSKTRLAVEFKKSVPTIRAAIKVAQRRENGNAEG
jgi:hypothetical protein